MRRLLLLTFLLFSVVLPPPLMAVETLTYVGATTLQRFFMPQAAHAFFSSTGIPVRIHGGNTDPGLKEVLSGGAQIAGSGRFLREDEKRAGLMEHLIGWDPIAVVVHGSNPLESLTLEQLRGIFSGRIRNWKEVGGIDGQILVIAPPPGSGMRSVLKEQILQEDELAPTAIIVPLIADLEKLVVGFNLAICVQSAALVSAPGVKMIRVNGTGLREGRYPLRKPLILVTLNPAAPAADKFVRFVLSPQGQQTLSLHFQPIDPD